MVKRVATVCASACLLFILNACTQDKGSDTALANDKTEPAHALRIAAAANLSDVLPDIIDRYKTDKHIPEQDIPDIEVTYASSGKLYAQIKAGAPYDIFLSANQSFPAKLADENLIDDLTDDLDENDKHAQPFTYTRGQLAIYSVTKPLNNTDSLVLTDLFQDNSKITIANPELAPYGASAKSYLQSQKIYDELNTNKRLIQSENIGQAFQYTHTGSVDYGFVAQSQLIAIQAKPDQFVTLPPASYPAILQDGIVIHNTLSATAFISYLRSEVGQQYLSQAGYLPIQ